MVVGGASAKQYFPPMSDYVVLIEVVMVWWLVGVIKLVISGNSFGSWLKLILINVCTLIKTRVSVGALGLQCHRP